MAKINHNNAFETINSFIENARMQNAVHLYAEDEILTGRSLKIADTDCWHFATTGYLGMEQDMRLKQAAAEAVMKYGTQFPLSKTYISHPLYAELEDLLFKMFNRPVIVCKNSTLAHLGVIPQALEQTGNSINTVHTAFRIDTGKLTKPLPHKRYTVKKWNSIADIPKALWNDTLGNSNTFDYAGMLFVEKTFTSLPASSYNLMTFWYYGFFDTDGDCVGLVGMSQALWKEDMLAKPQVSQKIEEVRKKEPLFLVELAWSSGTTFSEGVHLYLKDNCTEVLSEMIGTITADFDKSLAEKMVFRDFEEDVNLNGCFLDKGFVQVEMPDTAVAELNDQNFSEMLSKRNRRHLKEEVLPYTGVYTITLTSFLTPDELKHAHRLYLMVKDNNLAINNFPYEEKVFDEMNQHPNWYFLKAVNPADGSLAGCMFCYYNEVAQSFSPVLIGMDEVPDRLLLYRQLLYHTLLFAVEMKCTKSYLGLSASFEKKKMGARIIKKYAYVQAKDTYSSDLLATFE